MASNQTVMSTLSEDFEFWKVFEDISRIPTVDELICRVIGARYPRGIITDGYGNFITPRPDAQDVSKQVLFTLQIAIDTERDFWVRYLREAKVYGPFAAAVRLGASVAMDEAEAMIVDALEWVGNVHRLDVLYHAAYATALYHCNEEGRELVWPPFADSGEEAVSTEDVPVSAPKKGKKEESK
ncbi:hypothetical protein NPX13_g3657 [Xylaria arbuscula]|uniref:Uncharacterized protein n=1 Tax=Xylaria arbuscula TaxID=114810 RepID=A0A9W8TPW4_9PEZI|nr:hypothetical protein NPX13_g3657 [Xylaria arbuscula]